MDLLMRTVVPGFLALLFFILSVTATKQRRHVAGLALGVLELLSAAASCSTWAYALKISGKVDWFLFGIWGYTPIALICFAMFAVGAICIVVNAQGIRKHKKVIAPAA